MRTTPFLFSILSATLLSAGAISVQAAEGKFYDPSNAASPTGFTTNYEDFKTIGCPSQGLLGTPCKAAKPADKDGDGVTDDKDKCPNTPAGRKVNADGCELDSDGDGIVDGADACPQVYAKTPDGCPLPVAAKPAAVAPVAAPVPAPVPVKLRLEGVNFDYNKDTLRQEDIAVLDRDALSFVRSNSDVIVEVGGHTDSRGGDAYNMDLSQRRAETVINYLISKGVPADRLVAKGYGESQPISSNDTDEGRFQNRRVELVPLR